MSFEEDLQFGRLAEAAVIDAMVKAIGQAEPYGSKDSGKDLEIRVRFEVKSDRLAHRTGNVAIELSREDVLTGLMATEADWWVWDLGEGAWFYARPREVKEWLKDHAERWRQVHGGDGNRTRLALIPIFYFVTQIATKLK